MDISVTPIDGINEKLKRANENIVNLDREIVRFLKPYKHGIRPNKTVQAKIATLRRLQAESISPRFSVLAGEIIHHFRSCLDHIVWHLSRSAYRERFPDRIEFPIFVEQPRDKDKIARYHRKIHGIGSIAALTMIEELQPYNGREPLDHPLSIIHNMDRFDKHRELVVVDHGVEWEFPPELLAYAMRYANPQSGPMPKSIAIEFDKHLKLTPSIAFRQFGKRENQPVVPSLKSLESFIRNKVVARFEGELLEC
jgi:hypothetical protein